MCGGATYRYVDPSTRVPSLHVSFNPSHPKQSKWGASSDVSDDAPTHSEIEKCVLKQKIGIKTLGVGIAWAKKTTHIEHNHDLLMNKFFNGALRMW